MQEIKGVLEHWFSSRNRGEIKICGAIDVSSFDNSHVKLSTVCGDMIIEGEELKVSVLDLDSGIVEVEGTLNGVFYIKENSAPKRGLFGKNR